MKIAPPTEKEIERLKALYDYDVLDTDAEKLFDELTQLASQICDKPITLISLVDPDRQWFKSTLGLDAKETSRDIAFCAHAIHQQEIFEVEDTFQDTRFFDNPLVTSAPFIRFYAGTPLITPEGHAIGTLCVIDSKPNKLTGKQRHALEVLGRSVISQLELRKSVKQLKQANEHKTEFLSNMSHELRTPLNGIIGFSRLLKDQTKAHQLPDQYSEFLGYIDYSAKRLLNVVNSVIDISKIEAGKMQVQITPTQMLPLLKGLEGMMAVHAVEKGVDMSFDITSNIPALLAIDHGKVSQIITNLVHNAIKFTNSGKWVRAEFTWRNQQLIITVADQGVGISKGDQAKLFNKFQQVGMAKNTEGSGLGLFITKSLVNFLKGDIKVLSTLGSGSIFKVFLPAQQVILKGNETALHTNMQPLFDKTKRILLVEDNEINQQVMLATFDSLGMPITLVGSGEEAVDITKDRHFDLILMDIQLPGIDGKQAAKLIRAKANSIPIVALSADAFSQTQTPGSARLWDEYLCKPIEKEQLINTLNRFIPLNKDA
jgi:K+-sensing histidine kinase KdpD/CheY-like chemotaxis protein